MSDIPARLRNEVIDRAGGRCEYCGLAQVGQEATFHVDHVIPRSAGGLTVSQNLALACVSCSLRKWAKQRDVDPLTGISALLYHPRNDDWAEQFRWDGVFMVGLTPTGRATVESLQLNRPKIVKIRKNELRRGRHPPDLGRGRRGSRPPPKG